MTFKSIPYESLSFNPFTKIGKEWALLTAGTEGNYNTMTVSWGALGFIWGKPALRGTYHQNHRASEKDQSLRASRL